MSTPTNQPKKEKQFKKSSIDRWKAIFVYFVIDQILDASLGKNLKAAATSQKAVKWFSSNVTNEIAPNRIAFTALSSSATVNRKRARKGNSWLDWFDNKQNHNSLIFQYINIQISARFSGDVSMRLGSQSRSYNVADCLHGRFVERTTIKLRYWIELILNLRVFSTSKYSIWRYVDVEIINYPFEKDGEAFVEGLGQPSNKSCTFRNNEANLMTFYEDQQITEEVVEFPPGTELVMLKSSH